MIEILSRLFQRDSEKLKSEIISYKNEKKIWEVVGNVKNSTGNLCLHICGNFQHFIGAVLGNYGYKGERDLEFSKKNAPIKELLNEIDSTIQIVEITLNELKEEKLDATFPINVFGYNMTTGFFLSHLTTHLNYHLGQISYH